MGGRRHGRLGMVAAGWLAIAASGAAVGQDTPAGEPDIFVIAGKLRQVKIVYKERGNNLGQCNVRIGKEARIIDQMMCSLLASCIADNWSGIERATKCINARVNELELQAQQGRTAPAASPFPDQWLARGYETARRQDADELAPIPGAAIRPGSWVFTEMSVGRSSTNSSAPYIMRWRTCVTPALGDRALSRLLAPPPYTENLRPAVPAECRRWNIKADGGALSGSMACQAPSGASSSGKLEGRFTEDRLVTRRERRWRKDGAWATATFDTSATRDGNCAT